MSTLRRQGAWAVTDQVLSSGTNFVPALLLARVLGPAGYGAFSLAFLAWFGVLALLRAALMQPYTLAAAHLEGDAWRAVTARAGGAVVISGVVFGVVFAAASVVVGAGSDISQALLAIAVLAPGLALQEFWRVASFAASRARTATANDGIWAASQVIAFAILLTRGHVGVAGCLLAWGIGAVCAAILGAIQLEVVPRANRSAIRWARDWVAVSAWFTAVSAIFTLGTLAVAVIIAAKTGNAALGRFRTVQNLFGPIQLLTIGAESVFLPHLVRAIRRTTSAGYRESRHYSLLMATAVALYGSVLLVAAHTVLTAVFGDGFGSAAVLVLPTMLSFVLDAAWSGAALQLRANAMGSRLVVAQLAATSVRVGAVLVLASFYGLLAATWGLVIGSGVGAVIFWVEVKLMLDQGTSTLFDPPSLARTHVLAETETIA